VACLPAHAKERFRLPSWLIPAASPGESFRLEQQVILAGGRIHVCRTLINAGVADILVSRHFPGMNNREFGTYFLGGNGAPLEGRSSTHASTAFPPVRNGPDDMSVFTRLKAGGRLEDCMDLPAPRRSGSFFVISAYQPMLHRSAVEPAMLSAHKIWTIETGSLLTDICSVEPKRRRVRCGRRRAPRARVDAARPPS
jgi:hypothetical protein